MHGGHAFARGIEWHFGNARKADLEVRLRQPYLGGGQQQRTFGWITDQPRFTLTLVIGSAISFEQRIVAQHPANQEQRQCGMFSQQRR